MDTKTHTHGFTLIELMVALAVLSTLMVVGVPAFQTFTQNNRQTSQQNGLVLSLLSGRSEAVKANVPVVVCTSKDGASCRDCDSNPGPADAECGNWEDGWIVFTDVVRTDPDTEEGVVNPGANADLCEPGEDCVLGIYASLGTGNTLRLVDGGDGNAITFDTTGASDISGTFTMCMPKTTVYKQLTISSTGRPMTGEKSPAGAKVTSCP